VHFAPSHIHAERAATLTRQTIRCEIVCFLVWFAWCVRGYLLTPHLTLAATRRLFLVCFRSYFLFVRCQPLGSNCTARAHATAFRPFHHSTKNVIHFAKQRLSAGPSRYYHIIFFHVHNTAGAVKMHRKESENHPRPPRTFHPTALFVLDACTAGVCRDSCSGS